ncbi:MAG: peptidoglycan bridge formation glycyltransferase FemA/FemB family protein [Bacilli bacterium]|nr:peptidoglycan bridge formation glycyltransferase FemA/FemB family protein [Bacilli bacterium]
MEFVTLTEEEFSDYSLKSPYTSFFQMPLWAEVKKDNGWDSYYVGLKDNGEVVAATLLLSKKIKFFKNMFYAPRGFLLDYEDFEKVEEFTKGLKDFLKDKNALFLKINPYVDYQERTVDGDIVEGTAKDSLMNKLKELGYVHNGFYIDQDKKTDLEPRWISVLDLKDISSIDDAYKNMRSSTKWRINNSRKNCLEIIEADEENLFEFKNLMKHTAERREFVDRPLSYYLNMFKILKRENLVKVLLVKIHFDQLLDFSKKALEENNQLMKELEGHGNKEKQLKEVRLEHDRLVEKIAVLENTIQEEGNSKIIAGGWYMLYGHEINYLFGASYKKFMKYNSQYLLQYEMIDYAIKNHYDAFNFYGIDGNFDEKSKGYGLFDFKRGFNACVHELIGEFDLVIDKSRYSLYRFSFSMYKKIKKIISR